MQMPQRDTLVPQHASYTVNKGQMRRATSHLPKLFPSSRASLVLRNSVASPKAPAAEELPSARKEELHEEFARAQQSRTASSGPDGDEAGPRLSGLQLFYGPMYAGKTSALAKEITKLKASGQQGMQVVKSLVDWRYDSLDKDGKGQIRDGQIVTHSGERHECKAVQRLEHLRQLPEFDDIQVLFIDEAHFIPDLKDFCLDVARSKMVFVAGLDMDYRKERFGQILDLAELNPRPFPNYKPQALTSVCAHCGGEARYTRRTVAAREQFLVGGSEAYEVTCEEHHGTDPPSQ